MSWFDFGKELENELKLSFMDGCGGCILVWMIKNCLLGVGWVGVVEGWILFFMLVLVLS